MDTNAKANGIRATDPPTLPTGDVIDRLRQRAAAYLPPPAEEETARLARVTTDRLRADLGRRYAPEAASLETFRVYHKAQPPVLDRLRAIAADIQRFVEDSRGLVLYGPVGTGKDHLLAALLYHAAAKGIGCRWVNGQEVFGQFHDRMDTGQADEGTFRELARPAVLGVSDPVPPVGNLGAWDIRNFYRVADRRYRLGVPTWLTVNAASVDDLDAKLSEPVFDRLRHGAELVCCDWPSYRERVGA
jgi:DNA replication protein DnaC